MNTLSNLPQAIPETSWAQIQESNRILTEKFDKAERLFEKYRIEAEKSRTEAEKSRIAYEKRMKNMEDRVGAWSNNHGSFAEEYFFNAFENGEKNFFGEYFNEIGKNIANVWKGLKDEYDIVLYNDNSVALIEVKYKAHKRDIEKVLKKAETFRILFPSYKTFKIYLGLASLSFYPELEQECVNQGIAVIKQVGDTVVINDIYLKVF